MPHGMLSIAKEHPHKSRQPREVRRAVFEHENAPFYCLEAEISTPTALSSFDQSSNLGYFAWSDGPSISVIAGVGTMHAGAWRQGALRHLKNRFHGGHGRSQEL
jgi:hypothetical protein